MSHARREFLPTPGQRAKQRARGIEIKRAAAAVSEKDFQEMVLDLARVTGWKLRYHTFDSRKSTPGFPDLVMVRGQRLIFAELKRDGERLTPDQLTWIGGLECTSAEVYVWRPENWDQIVKILYRSKTA